MERISLGRSGSRGEWVFERGRMGFAVSLRLADMAVGNACAQRARAREHRTRALVDAHFLFVWRLLRRLDVPESDVDDAVQRVFIVASRKLDSIPEASERSFLFGTALRVASSFRRTAQRRGEVDNEHLAPIADDGPPADEAVARRQGVEILDRIISGMPEELREVFVLCELEELAVPDAAVLQRIPTGTAASRLRRARKAFEDAAKRISMKNRRREASP
jgi:RNA polymerase sigma-70 factor (ECF subfamily)